MLEQLNLKNFKGFKELKGLNIKPVTILCGTNSCGKSSILQSILLMKQTLESKNPNQSALLNGRFVHLGLFENIIFEKDISRDITFDFSFKFSLNDRSIGVPAFVFRDLMESTVYNRDNTYRIRYSTTIKTKQESKSHLKALEIQSLAILVEAITPNQDIIPQSSINLTLKSDGNYDITWDNLAVRLGAKTQEKLSGSIRAQLRFGNLFPVSYVNDTDISSNRHEIISYFLFRLNDILNSFFKTYTYVGPLREEPSRRYIYEDEVVEIGSKGENAAYLYLTEYEKPLKDHFFYLAETDSFVKFGDNLSISKAVSYWLNLMNIKDFNPEIANEIIYLSLKSGSSDKVRVSIADVGFGVSQVFPIILEGLRMPKRNTLLLEQPEIHLHPKLQMQMADYFISLALSNKNVIVETHSDHIINRLVRRIVEDDIHDLKDMIAIYFITPSPEGTKYEEIKIDEIKGITNWPEEFFDQVATEQEKIIQASIKKRKALKNMGGSFQ